MGIEPSNTQRTYADTWKNPFGIKRDTNAQFFLVVTINFFRALAFPTLIPEAICLGKLYFQNKNVVQSNKGNPTADKVGAASQKVLRTASSIEREPLLNDLLQIITKYVNGTDEFESPLNLSKLLKDIKSDDKDFIFKLRNIVTSDQFEKGYQLIQNIREMEESSPYTERICAQILNCITFLKNKNDEELKTIVKVGGIDITAAESAVNQLKLMVEILRRPQLIAAIKLKIGNIQADKVDQTLDSLINDMLEPKVREIDTGNPADINPQLKLNSTEEDPISTLRDLLSKSFVEQSNHIS